MTVNAMVPFLRPYVSNALPTIGPKKAVDAKPVRKSLLTKAIDAGTPLKTFDE